MRDVHIRRFEPGDRTDVLALLRVSLGWTDENEFDRFFTWKHEQSPFGPSPGWVATVGRDIVGFRTLLPWRFDFGGRTMHAVRAVDTATHPEHRGRGIFRALTMGALDDLATDGVDFVFNTPNAQSRPGYLKMGWHDVGRIPLSVRISSIRAPWRMARSRVAAERWADGTGPADAASDVLADPDLDGLISPTRSRPAARLRTARSVEYLRWRYGFAPLGYRAIALDDRVSDGVAIFRNRRRGTAVECALVEILVPGGDASASRRLVRAVSRACDVDYVACVGGAGLTSGFVRTVRLGPMLTQRAVRDAAPGASMREWDLSLGDVELF